MVLTVACLLSLYWQSSSLSINLFCIHSLVWPQFPDRFVDGPCLLGGSECGGSGLLPAFPSVGHPLLATVGDLKAFSYILRTVPLWCRQVVSASMYSF